MAANIEIADDWGWFKQLKEPLSGSDEVMVKRGDEVYRLSYDALSGTIVEEAVSEVGEVPQVPDPLGGWGHWADSVHTSGSPQEITGGARTQFTVDGLGATTETSMLPGEDSGVFSSSVIHPNNIGDAFMLRIRITVVPQAVSQGEYVEVHLDIGSGSQVNIVTDRIELTKGIGVAHVKALSFPIFCMSTFNANGGVIYITPSIDVNVYDKSIYLQRTFRP